MLSVHFNLSVALVLKTKEVCNLNIAKKHSNSNKSKLEANAKDNF